MESDEFIAAARTMLGVRWKHQGRHPQFGVDCAGFAVCAARMCGHGTIDRTDYARAPSASDFVEQLKKNGDMIRIGDEQPGDVMIFEFGGNPQHLGILTAVDPPMMIHAFATARKVVEHRMDDEWLARRRFIFRLRDQ